MQAAGGIQEHHVVAMFFGMLHGGFGNVNGVGLPHLEDRDVQLFTHHFQLPDGGGAVDITGGQQGALALLFHQSGQFGAIGGFTCTLQAHQHDYGGRGRGDGQLAVPAAHESGELLIDDLDDHLGRGEGLQHIGAYGTLGDRGHKVLDHLKVDVRLQKSHFDLFHGDLHVRLADAALATQASEGGGEFFR